jgi:proteasome lid subunit RPN8/RPN11
MTSRKEKEGSGEPREPPKVEVSGWKESARRTHSESFPGPEDADEILRVALGGAGYADLIAHAKSSLDREVCGVLVGRQCEDRHGRFVEVQAIIRGEAAKERGAHVTYTQETWKAIHEVKDRDFPRLQIVGWYHTHPGFGVEFSEMDMFIQENFFSGAGQVAYLTDPLGGEEALCVNTPEGPRLLGRFWVDGRERTCRRARPAQAHGGGEAPGSTEIERVEAQMKQVLRRVEEQQVLFTRVVGGVGFTLAALVLYWIVAGIWDRLTYVPQEPQLRQFVPVSVQYGERKVMLGIGVVEWSVPPELDAVQLGLEARRQQIEAERAAEAAKAAGIPAGSAPVEDAGEDRR